MNTEIYFLHNWAEFVLARVTKIIYLKHIYVKWELAKTIKMEGRLDVKTVENQQQSTGIQKFAFR